MSLASFVTNFLLNFLKMFYLRSPVIAIIFAEELYRLILQIYLKIE